MRMYNEVICFIGTTTESVDEAGDTISVKAEREVLAKLLSVGQGEFYQAQALGLKPELKFRIADYMDYEGEKTVKYEDKEYEILRTYRDGINLEITLKGDVNVNT